MTQFISQLKISTLVSHWFELSPSSFETSEGFCQRSRGQSGSKAGADPGFLERGVQPLNKGTRGGGAGRANDHTDVTGSGLFSKREATASK
jgi:hypothetical protein